MVSKLQSVALSPDAVLEYVEQGDRSAIPVILLHGLSDSWRSYERVLQHLPDSIHAFALSMRGHGSSGHPADGYRPRDFAADVAAFMDRLSIDAAVIVGHSLGSAVAQRFAIDQPQRALGLVLVGAFASLPRNPAAHELWSVVSSLTDPVDVDFVREFQQSTLAQPVPPEFFETVVHESLKLPARVWRATVEGSLQDDFSAQLHRIAAPTLIVWGEHDQTAGRSEQDALTSALPNARLVVYPDAGHGLHWEEPQRFAADLAGFVDATVAASGAVGIRANAAPTTPRR
ncbi:MAG TPA: alpha/beta hydrolase [Burkholderiaceae bacterium]|nr:alpha/beta hydrolase [Burkholderiaceae bacterium]